MLVEAAKLQGYPIAILLLSLAACRLRRAIGVDGVFSRTIVATRANTAVSGFATSELRVTLLMLDIHCAAPEFSSPRCMLMISPSQ